MKKNLIALVTLLAAAGAAHAQGKKNLAPGNGIEWQGDWADAVDEATARNVPIMFTIHKDN